MEDRPKSDEEGSSLGTLVQRKVVPFTAAGCSLVQVTAQELSNSLNKFIEKMDIDVALSTAVDSKEKELDLFVKVLMPGKKFEEKPVALKCAVMRLFDGALAV